MDLLNSTKTLTDSQKQKDRDWSLKSRKFWYGDLLQQLDGWWNEAAFQGSVNWVGHWDIDKIFYNPSISVSSANQNWVLGEIREPLQKTSFWQLTILLISCLSRRKSVLLAANELCGARLSCRKLKNSWKNCLWKKSFFSTVRCPFCMFE